MTIAQAIILGIVQGITEFLPISSSAHLIVIRYFFRMGELLDGSAWLTFDIALHFGTMLAIACFFFFDFIAMFRDGFKFKKDGKFSFSNLPQSGKLLWYIIAACIPAGVIGLLFDDVIENYVREPWIIAITLTIMGLLLYIVDKKSKEEVELKNITFKQAFIIGICQVFAMIPGFSRSGTTMTAARMMKLDKETSAKFSFLLGAPVMLGVAIYGLKDVTLATLTLPFFIGVVASFLVGLLAIRFLMGIVKKKGFGIFAIYRFLLSIAIVIVMLVRG